MPTRIHHRGSFRWHGSAQADSDGDRQLDDIRLIGGNCRQGLGTYERIECGLIEVERSRFPDDSRRWHHADAVHAEAYMGGAPLTNCTGAGRVAAEPFQMREDQAFPIEPDVTGKPIDVGSNCARRRGWRSQRLQFDYKRREDPKLRSGLQMVKRSGLAVAGQSSWRSNDR